MSIDKTKLQSALIELGKAILTALIAFLTALFASSCGSVTKATIRNGAESTSTSVTITTNNPTNWDVSPDVQLSMPRK